MRVTAIDFETANGSPVSICSVGVSVLQDGAGEEAYQTLIRPPEEHSFFSAFNTQIHGIVQEDTADAPSFPEVYPHLTDLFEDAVVTAHNARFDMECLKQSCLFWHLPVPDIVYFDTVELSRKVYPYLEHHRLNDMCEYLHVDLEHHNAGSDAWGCLMIVMQTMNLAGIYDIETLLEQCRTEVYHLKEDSEC